MTLVAPAAARTQALDAPLLRQALGRFATGVALVAVRADDGQPLALTINSFSSLSLDPPLVLWSLGRQSGRHEAFARATQWSVNILQQSQLALARRFAARDAAGASDAGFVPGCTDAPVLRSALAGFECRRRDALDFGDHTLLIGEIVAVHRSEGDPLVFYSGKFRTCTEPMEA